MQGPSRSSRLRACVLGRGVEITRRRESGSGWRLLADLAFSRPGRGLEAAVCVGGAITAIPRDETDGFAYRYMG